MPARQLRLFDHPKPLLERLGAFFFKSLPKSPGVYMMFGSADRLLYVGQTNNLRVRLGTYKNCNPDNVPRKVLRLVHQVDRIQWELCEDAQHARLRENYLLRTRRPRFNRMNTFPGAYYFFGLKSTGKALDLWLTSELKYTEPLFGAFKGNTRQAFNALVMMLWSCLRQPRSLEDFPAGLLSKPPRRYTFESVEDPVLKRVQEFLSGTSTALLQLFESRLAGSVEPAILRSLYATALETLQGFYLAGPRRTRRLREENGIKENLLLQEQLDDLIVASGPPKTAPHDYGLLSR
jgi:GIY-YIG catalytic domain-containing protein